MVWSARYFRPLTGAGAVGRLRGVLTRTDVPPAPLYGEDHERGDLAW
jgi:hypothetical protein